MDRNNRGEATRRASAATTMVTSSNGLPRRRHRTNSLRDSPEDDVAMELIQEPSSRLRDRGGLKKDRDHRDRDRSSSRTKRQRRAERLIHGSSNNREDVGGGGGGGGLGEDSSEESVNDEEDEEEEDGCGGGSYRMLPPNPVSNNHLSQHRKSYPPTPSDKVVFRPSVPVWKPGDEMIGVSIPRKARSASTKRGGGGGGGGGVEMVGGFEQIQRQASSSPVRQSVISTLTAAPMSPSSSNASVRKKMKANNGLKPRPPPPKSSSKSTSSSNPEELEFEIAEVLYGLMTQSSSSKKEVESNETREANNTNNKSTSDAKSSGVSSPISNSPLIWPPLNSNGSSAAPLSAVAPKRKRPRQVVENMVVGSFEGRGSSTIITTKVEMDHQPPKTENSSPKNPGSVAENGGCAYDLGNLVNSQGLVPTSSYSEPEEVKPLMIEEAAAGGSPKKESAAVVRLLEDNMKSEDVTKTATTNLNSACSEMEMEKPKEEKFHIDLMAPPPQLRSSPEREDKVDFALTKAAVEDKPMVSNVDVEMVAKEEDKKGVKIGKDEAVNVAMEEERKAKSITDHAESQKPIENNKGRNIDLQLDLEKPDRESANNKLQHQVQKQQQQQPPAKATRETASHPERTVQSSSLPLPMSMASWPGGLPPMGYMAPLQGVVSMDGSAMPSAPMQPLFSQPRPKRCETHCYIARNIHYLQQCMKVNPFWSAAGGTASLFGAKPGSLNVMPSADLNGNIAGRGMNPVQDKGQSLGIFPGMTGKDKVPQAANIVDATQRKQQILLQQALPPVAPNNILHGPAFIFPLNHQQAAVAATAATRPGFAKSHTTAGTPSHASSSATVNSSATAVGAGAATAMSFTYPTLPANEAQYLAILQNNAYPFPIPAVGAPPNYRGSHAQAMPLYNGSFYSSQMIHPSQLQQQQAPPSQSHQVQHANHNTSISSSSSSSHKHLQSQQQKPQVGAVNGGSGGGNLHSYPAAKNRLSQPQQQQQQQNQHLSSSQQSRQLEVEVGGEDSPSAVDSRLSRATMSVHGQNFAMPIHSQNFALMTPPAALATTASGSGNPNEKKQQQQPQQLGLKGGVDSLPPQTFAMSFTTINGPTTTPGIDISSMAQNHAILQSLPDATTRQNYQMMTVAAATQVAAHQQQKNFRIGEDGKTGVSDSSNADEERKALGSKTATTGGQSIAFSRDLTGGSGPARTSSPIPNAVGSLNASSSQLAKALQAQQQQQQMIQLQKRQQQHQHQHQQHQHQQQQFAAAVAARSKTAATSNGSVYSEHVTSVSSVPAKFSNSLSAFPQNLVQSSNSNSPAQSPQWKNSGRPTNSQAPSSVVSTTTSSLKNLPQQQARGVQQSNMQISQISFSANQKSSAVLHGQQTAGNNHQSTSPPMVGGSPTTSSISKGASGSPRTTSASTSNKAGQASALSSQHAKKSPSASSQKSSPVGGRNVSSILGNHHITSSPSSGAKSQIMQQQQQQLPTNIQQGQLFFSNPFMQAQSPHSTSTGSNVSGSGFYLQRRHSEQQKQPQQPPASSAASSSGMLLISTSTTDTAKGITAAAASNMKGGSLTSQGILQAAQFTAQSQGNQHQLLPAGFSYVHAVPTAVQVKQAEQKQPAGNVNLHACWQPEKK